MWEDVGRLSMKHQELFQARNTGAFGAFTLRWGSVSYGREKMLFVPKSKEHLQSFIPFFTLRKAGFCSNEICDGEGHQGDVGNVLGPCPALDARLAGAPASGSGLGFVGLWFVLVPEAAQISDLSCLLPPTKNL